MTVEQLVLDNIGYVHKIAKGYYGYGIPVEDLVQEGTIGLIKAAQRFEPTRGSTICNFATWYIKREIQMYIVKNWQVFTTARHDKQYKLFFKLRKYKSDLHWFKKHEIEQIAKEMNTSEREVIDMEAKLYMSDTLDAMDDDVWIEDTNTPSHNDVSQDLLYEAMATLDERSRDIIHKRYLNEDKTLRKDLAKQYGISKERSRQIEDAALLKMRAALS